MLQIELHAEINELYAVAASPELYPTLVEAGSVASILGMVAHENTDISIAAVGLIQEMTDPDIIAEEASAMGFVDALVAQVRRVYLSCTRFRTPPSSPLSSPHSHLLQRTNTACRTGWSSSCRTWGGWTRPTRRT